MKKTNNTPMLHEIPNPWNTMKCHDLMIHCDTLRYQYHSGVIDFDSWCPWLFLSLPAFAFSPWGQRVTKVPRDDYPSKPYMGLPLMPQNSQTNPGQITILSKVSLGTQTWPEKSRWQWRTLCLKGAQQTTLFVIFHCLLEQLQRKPPQQTIFSM